LKAETVIEIALRGGVIPALAAFVLFLLISWLWPSDVARRYRCGVAFALGAFISFVLLPSTQTLAPGQFYDWILYLGILAAFLSGLTRAEGVTRGERWTVVYVFAPVAAWIIVPQEFQPVPTWPIQFAGISLAIMLLTAIVNPLPQLLPGRAFPWWIMLVMATVSLLLFDQQGETFGRMAALPAGAFAGCGVAALFARQPVDWRSIVLPFVVFAVGYANLGAVYPTEPNWWFLLIPFVPLTLWICSVGPLSRLTGVRAFAVQAVCVIVPLIAIAALVGAGTDTAADGW
jgi:hypothetical protein